MVIRLLFIRIEHSTGYAAVNRVSSCFDFLSIKFGDKIKILNGCSTTLCIIKHFEAYVDDIETSRHVFTYSSWSQCYLASSLSTRSERNI